jgi:hypothetical protein
MFAPLCSTATCSFAAVHSDHRVLDEAYRMLPGRAGASA